MLSYKNHLKDYVLWLLVITVVLWSSLASGQSQIQVPGDYETIQAALEAAQDGDEVVVAGTTYQGEGNVGIEIAEKAIVLRSADGPAKCFIDGGGSSPAFLFPTGTGTADIQVVGFTFQNGKNNYGGAAYVGPNRSVTFKNCIFQSNEGSYGGAVACRYATATFINCVMTRNSAGNGGAIFLQFSDSKLIHCTLYANSAENYGRGICSQSSTTSVVNSILWNDHSLDDKEIYVYSGLRPHVVYSDVKGGWEDGEGNIIDSIINSDPGFVADDVHLMEGSPCMDAGASGVDLGVELPEFDFEGDSRVSGQAPDIGADEYVAMGQVTSEKGPITSEIDIDIKPGSGRNSINFKSRGVTPVAVLATEKFDPSAISFESILFAGATPERYSFEDVNRDGLMDMVLHFRTQALDLGGESIEATLTGALTDGTKIVGTQIIGTDDVRVVPSKKCKGKLKGFKGKKLRAKAKRWRR